MLINGTKLYISFNGVEGGVQALGMEEFPF